jgi:hypothetical protein
VQKQIPKKYMRVVLTNETRWYLSAVSRQGIFIPAHTTQFSRRIGVEANNMDTDQEFMDEMYQTDFYLVNRLGELRIS